MKKLTLISLISALSCSSLVHAGGMGGQTGTPVFISLEGGYTVHTIDNYDFAVTDLNLALSSVKKNQHYTGRLGAGMINMLDEQVGMTGEIGWGYYGRTTLNPDLIGFGDFTIQHTLTGFDALIGIAYIQPSFSLSVKAGAMIQNMTTKTTSTGVFALFSSSVFDSVIVKTNQTAVLPEVKLGASYNFDNNWGVTAAYMLAYGSSSRTNGNFNTATGIATLNVNNLNPTTNTLLLGIQYTC